MTPLIPPEITDAALARIAGRARPLGPAGYLGFPKGIKFVFVFAQAAEVVKMLAMPKADGKHPKTRHTSIFGLTRPRALRSVLFP